MDHCLLNLSIGIDSRVRYIWRVLLTLGQLTWELYGHKIHEVNCPRVNNVEKSYFGE